MANAEKNNSKSEVKSEVRMRVKEGLAKYLNAQTPEIFNQVNARLAKNIEVVLPQKAVVGAFVSRPDEPLINAFVNKKNFTFVYPRAEGDEIQFYKTLHEGDFVEGRLGILEPAPERATVVEKNDIEVLLIPAVAYDQKLMRLGRGKGFYDRYLRNFKGLKIGVCFKEQVLPALPIEDHDVPVDVLITEDYILRRFDS